MEAKPVKKHTILWADDDPDDLEMFREIMQELNHDTQTLMFSNGSEVLHYLKNCPSNQFPCLIVLDMNMPILSGRETLKSLKAEERYSPIPVFIFSTSNNEADRSFCMKMGSELITKPPSYDRLKGIIQNLVNFCDLPTTHRP